MTIQKFFEHGLNIKFKTTHQDENYTMTASINEEQFGVITFQFISSPESGWYWFEGDIDEDDYFDMVAGSFAIIEHIEIKPLEQKSGIGTALLNRALDYCKTKFRVNLVFLNASSRTLGNEIPQRKLVEWYKKMGFVVLKDQGSNSIMFKKLV
jgi:GNAT superfamily N-acetyltransferase